MMMAYISDVLWKQEEEHQKHYALNLSLATFALLPAFLQLLNTNYFVENENKDNGYYDQKLTKQVKLLCTIISYATLCTTTWHVTRFMREDPTKRSLFFWGFKFFCKEAVLLSVLVFWYQNRLQDGDDILVKLTCNVWIILGLVATVRGILISYSDMLSTMSCRDVDDDNKLKKKKKQTLLALTNYAMMRNFLSDVLLILSHGLLLGIMDITYHAYFKYGESWIAIVTVTAYVHLLVAAVQLRADKEDLINEPPLFKMFMLISSMSYSGLYAITILLQPSDRHDPNDRSYFLKAYCAFAFGFMWCPASEGWIPIFYPSFSRVGNAIVTYMRVP